VPQTECPGSCNAALRRARREYQKSLADYDQALIDHAADPCPRCDRYSLVWEEGEDFVRCQRPACGRPLLLAEYEKAVEVWPHIPAA
jgi:hypothetical protein